MDLSRQTVETKIAQLKQYMAQAQQQLSTLNQQIGTLQAERDQVVQVVLRQQGALAGLQELLGTDDASGAPIPLPSNGVEPAGAVAR